MALRNAFENLAVESTQESIDGHLDNVDAALDIQLSALRDAVAGIGAAARSLGDVVSAIQANQPRTVTGTVTVANPTGVADVSGLATQATLASVLAAVDGLESTMNALLTELNQKLETGQAVNVGNFPATQQVAGTVTVGNFPNTQPVSGTVSVSQPVAVTDNGASLTTDTPQLPSTLHADGGVRVHVQSAVPITDNGQSVTVDGTVNVGNFPNSTGIHDAGNSITVDDGGASLTVDGAVAITNFGGQAQEATLTAVLNMLDNVRSELLQKLEPGQSVNVGNFGTSPLAKETTLQQMFDRLTDVFHAVDGLEVTAGNIELNADVLNLQTDELESLTRSVRDRLPPSLNGVDGGIPVHVQNPDELGLTDTQLRATPVAVSGTVTANLGTIDGAATDTSVLAVRDRLPATLDADGGLAVHLQNPGDIAAGGAGGEVDVDRRFEWQTVGGENKPLYIGQAPPASATGDPVWDIDKYMFEPGPTGSYVVAQIQRRAGSWDNRGTLF